MSIMQTPAVRSPPRVASSCDTCPLGARGECPGGPEFQGARLRRVSVKDVEAGADIYAGNETPETVAILRSGWAMQYARLRDGERQILTFLVPGDVFDQDAVILPQTPSLYHSARSLTPRSAISRSTTIVPYSLQMSGPAVSRNVNFAAISNLWLSILSQSVDAARSRAW